MDHAEYKNSINALGDGDKNTAAEVRFILSNLLQSIFLPGDIKIVYCSQEELLNDYDETGLGIGKREGWAMCNGLNDTPPMGGRVPVCLGDGYPEIGYRAGSKDAVVVQHNHAIVNAGNVNDGKPGGLNLFPKTARWDSGSGTLLNGEVSFVGESGLNKNMQPFIVLLYLMKL